MENQEYSRIQDKQKNWFRWGSYMSERQWGTVREDYSARGDAWKSTTYQDAIYRAFRWGEDGIAGITDSYCNLCFAFAFYNGKDSMIKERLFGLSNPQGNHGEDVKELYYHLDNTPTHSYMKYLYKYPQNAFPYDELIQKNADAGLQDKEFEILDTGIFDNNEYFDIYIEYAKADENDILIKISILNNANKEADIQLFPQLWMRNRWSFNEGVEKPIIQKIEKQNAVQTNQSRLGDYYFYFESADKLLFTENETNLRKIYKKPNEHIFTKDLFNRCVIKNNFTQAQQKSSGTKFSPFIKLILAAGESKTLHYRLSQNALENPFQDFDQIFWQRETECQNYYKDLSQNAPQELAELQKKALSGMLWSKQYYHYNVEKWLEGDLELPDPPKQRLNGRNHTWLNLRNEDILLMPDKWEYPWYASWDSAFHVISMALVDVDFAKHQLQLFLKEWYMKPNGQVPAYEWNFGDVNPPVQAWATLMVYQIEQKQKGKGDIDFLKKMFNKMALNFTWWVNQLDSSENNVFEGGFLGLDNIGIFDRSKGVPGKAKLEQVDGTSWMALYCLSMLKISLEISKTDAAYEDMATKFFGHFVYIAESLNHLDEDYFGIWDAKDGFFYDKLVFPDGRQELVKVRSIVGMLALIAVLHIPKETFDQLPTFKKSFDWFKTHRMDKLKFPIVQSLPDNDDVLLSLVPNDRIDTLMHALLDEKEFLSPFGIRSLSKIYEDPYVIHLDGKDYSIQYIPAESDSGMFGGNSNWRGPIWFPINYIMIDSLRELHKFFKDSTYAFPTGSENQLNLAEIAQAISQRLISIFLANENAERPVHTLHSDIYKSEKFKDLILFYEYFNPENGRGVGASHQTGWTALVANLIAELD